MRFQLVITVWVLLAPQAVNAQSTIRIDSLKKVIAKFSGIAKIDGLIDLAREYRNVHNDPANALDFIKQAEQISFELGDSLRITKSTRIKGQLMRMLENDSAIFSLTYAIGIAKRNNFKGELIHATNSMGIILSLRAQYDKALRLLQESLRLRYEVGNNGDIAIALNNIGLIFYKMKSYEKALNYFNESLRLKEEIRDFFDFDRALINSGLCHVYLDNYSEAFRLLIKGLNFCGDSCSLSVKSDGHFGLGVLYYRQDDFTNANFNFTKSYNCALEENSMRYQADNLVYLGKISYGLGKRKEGIYQLFEAEKIAKQYEYNELLISVYEELITMFGNNPEQLSIYQARLIELREKVYSVEMIENLSRIEADYLERENIARIEHQKEMIALNEQLIERQRLIAASTGVLISLFISLILILNKNNRFKQKINRLLEQKVQERSFELKQSIEELDRLYQQQCKKIFEARKEVAICAASVKEVCDQILMRDSSENTKECVLLMNATTNHMLTETNKEVVSEDVDFKNRQQVVALG